MKRLNKNRQIIDGFDYSLGRILHAESFSKIEKDLNIQIPNKIKEFYLAVNGLKTVNPCFELIEISSWKVDSGLIHFATFDHLHKVHFKASEFNQAGEWTIINIKDNYDITLTISSFWSNKIWYWIEQDKKIWSDNWWIDEQKFKMEAKKVIRK